LQARIVFYEGDGDGDDKGDDVDDESLSNESSQSDDDLQENMDQNQIGIEQLHVSSAPAYMKAPDQQYIMAPDNMQYMAPPDHSAMLEVHSLEQRPLDHISTSASRYFKPGQTEDNKMALCTSLVDIFLTFFSTERYQQEIKMTIICHSYFNS
jgi:hypothetical protein